MGVDIKDVRDSQSRKWIFTVNNPQEKGITHETIIATLGKLKSVVYFCLSDECGLKTHTFHTHIFIACSSPVRFSTLKKLFPAAEVEMARGTCEEVKAYIQKSGKWVDDPKADTAITGSFEEWGEMPEERQGKRTDLELLFELVSSGLSNYEIISQYPQFSMRLSDIDRLRLEILTHQTRATFRQLQVFYVFGKTGVGKTRGVMEAYSPFDVYRVSNYKNPFDSYKQERVLVMDEFYSANMPLEFLLNVCDGYCCYLPARYADKLALFNTVVIISNQSILSQYQYEQVHIPEKYNALLRRLTSIIEVRTDGRREYDPQQFVIPTDDKEPASKTLGQGFHPITDDETNPFLPVQTKL